MDSSFVKKIANARLYKALPNTYKVPLNICQPGYKHLTLKVTSLSQFVETVKIIRLASEKLEGDVIFRGMADYRWDLLPSIARQTLITEPTEHKIVKELLLLYPDEFTNISSNFDLLAKMQHYGLPTRLLDFTTNPLVALFFACKKEKRDIPGRVVVTVPKYQPFIGDYIEAVCGLYKTENFGSYYLEHLTKNVISFADFIYCMQYPLVAKPQYSNDRIKNQAAVFMVFPNEVLDHGAQSAYECLRIMGTVKNTNIRKEHQNILNIENLLKIYPEIKNDSNNVRNWFVTHKTLSDVCGYY